MRKSTCHTSLLTFWSLHFILFHLFHGWSMLRIFKLISYFFPKLSKTCTCERIVILLFICSVFQEILELYIKIIVFINNRMLRNRLIYSITAKLIIENVKIVKVILLTFLIRLFLNRVIVYHLLDISLNSITLFFYFPFTARTSIFVFRFGVLLFSHEFWEL